MFPYNFFLRVCFLKSVLLHSRISSMAVQEFCSQCYLATVRQYQPDFRPLLSNYCKGMTHCTVINLVSCLSYRDFQVHIGVVLKSMTEFVKVVAKTSRSPLQRQPLVS